MKKFLCILGLMVFVNLFMTVHAVDNINKAIANSKVKKDTISISVKDIETGKSVYELNQNRLISPASTQKIVTLAAAIDTLGPTYNFETSLYKNTNNELFLKLGADPYLREKDLTSLMNQAKAKKILEPKNIYIDDYIVDSVEWGEGWQWDDDLNSLMPKFGSYNLDGNLLYIFVAPTNNGAPANVYSKFFYPVTFMNLAVTDESKANNITFQRNNSISPDILTVKGSVSKIQYYTVPVPNLKRYFRLRLEDAIKDAKIEYYGKISQKKLPSDNVYLVASIKHPIKIAVGDILKNSNNMAAESVFKIAGGKYVNNTGSIAAAIKMFEAFCKKIGVNSDEIKIVDGSGVSKNNLMSADFMTNYLVALSQIPGFDLYKSILPTAGEGTLANRMLYFKDNLRAKTGTLADISAITGYLTSKSGKTYAFDIMINDAKTSPSDKKMLEEYILRAVYNYY
ncbi:TPA: D-alanyl-D-alanine carboxypeptidase/D-alanyl-D-alanine-endopeptidase [Candidatus Scatousia excrementigallinarum]|uniref:D-alanyl-D-alanine carboxypeptidase/D-alanyl-D-alanine-endopeptidase n=1 Tax=Candidatus Scatousia excrementigallinarum TaxID=2840935 RepID=A0A9D1EXW1_9BACT|nr:D-alanyl-D-alanine carboxypeptidase/D-alanyl-D-alanine-endopeptidase [Candidatus Scatousia excrementigallinarum]